MVKFESFNLPEAILRALSDMGFEEASPIQEAVIPALLAERDVIGQAQTGTGKTAAFGIPLVMAADQGRPGLVLCPTRELAQQVSAEIDRIGAHLGIKSIALYGGAAFGPQARAIQQGDFSIVVATPGRLRDHFERGTIDPASAKIVVLDEADEMLKMGFAEEVEEILTAVGRDRQTLLFSATMPDRILHIAQNHMRDPEHVAVAGRNDSLATENTEQFAVGVDAWEKPDALVRILAVERPTGTLVFRHTRESVDDLVRVLRQKGLQAEALHGGMEQNMRERVLSKLREGKGMVVVATNVAARGLDVDCISHVVNYDTPREAEAYVHRIGRTGRAGRDGKSFLFVTPADRGKLRGIERVLGHRLDWRNVPTDAEVRDAITANTAAWLAAQADVPTDGHLAAIDQALASGKDARHLAALLLGKLAPHEGLTMPPLEPRREQRGAGARAAQGGAGGARTRGQAAPTNGPRVPLTMSVGRDDGVRPGDLVGALTNEGGLVGADIGRIDILPRMSVVEVPQAALDQLADTMQNATIRGRRVQMRVAERWQFRAPMRNGVAR